MNLFLKRLGGFYKYRFLMQQAGKNMSADQFDAWMMENSLPAGFEAGFDGMEIALD